MPLIGLLAACALLFLAPMTSAWATDGDSLAGQRDVFRALLARAEAGRWPDVEARLGEIQGYPLLPDLRAAWLRGQLGRIDDRKIAAFLKDHQTLGFVPGLRRQWASSLAQRRAWADYLALYETHYAGSSDTVLACHALVARAALGRVDGLEEAVRARWISPVSLPDACDPAFAWLEKRGGLDAATRQTRLNLALKAGQFQLARWLARPLGEDAVAEVRRWQQVHDDPVSQLTPSIEHPDTATERARLLYGFQRLASLQPEIAAARWPAFRDRFSFSASERIAVDRRIALLHAWRHLPGAEALLSALPADGQDKDTRAWTLRVALRTEDWSAAERALAALPAEEDDAAWRYWRARMLEATGRAPAARPLYLALSAERGYYSFLAADRIKADYRWQHEPIPPDDDMIAALEANADIVRSRELFLVGLESYGRAEWQQALARLSPAQQAQAGILARRWGWYSRAITAASGAGAHDALDLRFPLPWRPIFEKHSERAGIDSAWAYGVARSESLFMPDVRSSAGALGVMQIMPATGRRLARRAGVPWSGQPTLIDPYTNIALGTAYLGDMLARYGNHRVLATAAYNAGPGRVDRWLPDDTTVPADVWIDSLPFGETRHYVQQVLASEAVFRWRMSGQTLRLREAMLPIPPRTTR